MRGIYTTSVNEATLDEAPSAYKPLEDILDVIWESVEVIDILQPVSYKHLDVYKRQSDNSLFWIWF